MLWIEKVKNLVKQSDTRPSVIRTELIDGGKREKWNYRLIRAKDEMKRVARDETVAIREESPLAYCCNNGNGVGKEWEKLNCNKNPRFRPLQNYGGRCEWCEQQMQN